MKILIVSHSPTSSTGYGRVVKCLAGNFIAAGNSIVCLGSGSRTARQSVPYPILPWHSPSAKEIADAIKGHRPDVLLTIGDPWMFEAVPKLPERKSVAWLAYYPVDGYPLPAAWQAWCRAVDVPVVFSKFARDVVRTATDRPPALIYHGVDSQRFHPGDRQKAKELAKVAGHFVVGTVARNQLRKNIPALIKAFARFAKGKDDALLYLHTQLRAEFDIAELVAACGIVDKTRITGEIRPDQGVADELLATVYRAMDIFVLPTMAEGFGLPIMEAQACGTPVLVTDFSACPELVPDPLQRLKVQTTLTMARNFEQAIVDVDDIVDKLNLLYHDRPRLAAMGERCHEFAKTFEWSIAYKQFNDLLVSKPFTELVRKRREVWEKEKAKSAGPFSGTVIRPDSIGKPTVTPNAGGKENPSTPTVAKEKKPKDEVVRLHEQAMLKLRSGETGAVADSIAVLQDVVARRPDNAEYQNDLAVAFQSAGRYEEAVRHYKLSLKLTPDRHQVWSNLSRTFLAAGDVERAGDAAMRALRVAPNSAPAMDAYATVLMEQGKHRQAAVILDKALSLMPPLVPAHIHLAQCLLMLREYKLGWEHYEHRFIPPARAADRAGERWTGDDPAEKTILLYCEGGDGNSIQLVRFASVVAGLGAIVTVECPASLAGLFATVPGVSNVISGRDSSGQFELHRSLMSLPAILKTTVETIPADVPYLKVPSDAAEKWQARLSSIPGHRVGVYCGDAGEDGPKAFPVAHVTPLAALEGVSLIDLCADRPTSADSTFRTVDGLEAVTNSPAELAALLTQLDLVITSDSMIAHLAGALGVPCWVALRSSADWRWMRDRDDSPWYPSVRLFRQEVRGEWTPVFRRIAETLQEKIASKPTTGQSLMNQRLDDDHSSELKESNAKSRLDEAVAELTPYPGGFEGRGIVILGGGTRYFPCAWVCIRMLRQCGCTLPIELWHLGADEMTPEMSGLVTPFDVRCVDGRAVTGLEEDHTLGGWELKPLAILHSRFREVLYLDADNFPVADPTFLFDATPYKRSGAAFWPDYKMLAEADPVWELTGVPYRPEPAFESGQILVDKSRCWEPLALTTWFNRNSGFWYRYLFGDKDTFHLAWRKLDRPYSMPSHPIRNLPYAMAQHDFDGRRLFQHRNRAKWVLDGWNPRMAEFEWEEQGFAFLEELRERWRPATPEFDLSATRHLQSAWKRYQAGETDGTLGLSVQFDEPEAWQAIGQLAEHTTRCIADSHTLNLTQKAIGRAPHLAELHAVRGTTLGAMGRHLDAGAAFQAALRINRELPGLQHNVKLCHSLCEQSQIPSENRY